MTTSNKHKDWHPADIKAALAKAVDKNGVGYTFARIARENGYVENSPNMVLHKPWPQIEEIISRITGVKAAIIWPTRYDHHGRPLKIGKSRVRKHDRDRAKVAQNRNRLNV